MKFFPTSLIVKRCINDLAQFEKVFFKDVRTGPGLLRRLPQPGIIVVSDDHHFRVGEGRFYRAGEDDSIDLFETDIHQDPIGPMCLVRRQRLVAVFTLKDLVRRSGDQAANRPPHSRAVFNDQNIHGQPQPWQSRVRRFPVSPESDAPSGASLIGVVEIVVDDVSQPTAVEHQVVGEFPRRVGPTRRQCQLVPNRIQLVDG